MGDAIGQACLHIELQCMGREGQIEGKKTKTYSLHIIMWIKLPTIIRRHSLSILYGPPPFESLRCVVECKVSIVRGNTNSNENTAL